MSTELSTNFFLYEFLKSEKAQKINAVEEQNNPSREVIENLTYLAKTTLQPARSFLDYSFTVNSGWRCKAVNDAVGSTNTSQHLKGEAADIDIENSMLTDDDKTTTHAIRELDRRIERITGKAPRPDVNANYYLWAYMCIHLDELDIDQIIHEYGADGKPAWIHVSSSGRQDRRRITVKRSGQRYVDVTLEKALLMGC